jgi:hypothetical protein
MIRRSILGLLLFAVACGKTPASQPDGGVCGVIQTSSYDQSCSTDDDCVPVTQGNLCDHGPCTNCTNGTVNRQAEALYSQDFAARLTVPVICPCPSGPAVVCRKGMCELTLGP